MAALGFAGHSRLLPLLATIIVLVLFKCVIARRWGLAAALAAACLAMTYASFAFTTMVFDHVWDDPASSNTVNTVVEATPPPRRKPALGARADLVPAGGDVRADGDRCRRARRAIAAEAWEDAVHRDPRRPSGVAGDGAADPRVDRVHVAPHPHRPPDLRPLQRRHPVAGVDHRHRMAGQPSAHAVQEVGGGGAYRHRAGDRRNQRRYPLRRR